MTKHTPSAPALRFHDQKFTITRRDGQPWLRGPQIGDALGYSKAGRISIDKLYKKHAAEFTDSMTALVKLKTAGGEQEVRIFSLRGAHLLGMFARTERAAEFRRWVLDILDAQTEGTAQRRAKPGANALAVQPALPATRAEKKRIRSREDLSFTKRDSEGRLINWHLTHDRNELWGPLYTVGQGYLNREIAELAAHDEAEAYNAVQFALSGSHEFRRGAATHFGNSGWGQECGFAEAIARAVIDGLRARRAGVDAYDPKAKKPPKLPKGAAPLALPAPMKELSKEEREAINKRAWAETSECARECFARRRAEMLNAAH